LSTAFVSFTPPTYWLERIDRYWAYVRFSNNAPEALRAHSFERAGFGDGRTQLICTGCGLFIWGPGWWHLSAQGRHQAGDATLMEPRLLPWSSFYCRSRNLGRRHSR